MQMQAMTRTQQSIIYFFGFVITIIGLYIFQNKFYPFYFPIDDAYIFLHNAQVLHLGYDQNYPNIPALYGTTSLVHLALVAINLFWLPPLYALFAVQCLIIPLYVLGLLRLAFVFNANFIQAISFLIIGLTIGLVPHHLLTGMDTALAMVTVLWALIFAETYQNKLSRYVLPFLCGLMPFVRPELTLLAVLLTLYQFKLIYQQLEFKKSLLLLISITALAAVPWIVWNWLDTGSIFPETIRAKIDFFAEVYFSWQEKLFVASVGFSKFLLGCGYFSLLGMAILLLRTSVGRVGLIFIIVLFVVYLLIFPTASFDNKGRYVYIMLPVFLYGLIAAIQSPEKLVRRYNNLLMVFCFIFSLAHLPISWNVYINGRNETIQSYNAVSQWCNQNLPKNSKLLIHDAGYMSYATSFQLIDLVGLKTPTSIMFHRKLTLPSQGSKRFEAVSEIMKYNHPDYLIVSAKVLRGLADDLRRRGWKLKPLYVSKEGFSVYQIQWM